MRVGVAMSGKTMTMQDDDERRQDRGGQPQGAPLPPFNPMPNRDQRRRIAKQNKMFKINRSDGWGNMNSRNINLQTRVNEQEETDIA